MVTTGVGSRRVSEGRCLQAGLLVLVAVNANVIVTESSRQDSTAQQGSAGVRGWLRLDFLQ